MVKVAVDAMGGDNAPGEIIRGALSALSYLEDLSLKFVGHEDRINQVLEDLKYSGDRVEIVHAEEVIECDDDPGLSIRGKTKSSMVKTLQLVRNGEADAAISAGNTGALMAAGVLFLGRLSGISRPALLTPMPSFGGQPVLYLDVGANMDARAEQLLQYAFMGRIYAQQVIGMAEPRIALLNVGVEPNKGNNQVKKAYKIFSEHLPGFCGNVEGTEAFFNAADVVVCDGFVGNIFLKTSEGLSRAILSYFRSGIKTKLRYKLGAYLLQPVFLGLREKIDSSGYGGAPLLGVNGLCIKCHGSSRARSIEQALIRQAYPFVHNKVTDKLQEALKELSCEIGEVADSDQSSKYNN
ncbi:MAG: phosphate acyltransferase PlsX [Firmicutes bacterium]|nr:phosphate acyltransferase PlsX [Bacillota bacterium]